MLQQKESWREVRKGRLLHGPGGQGQTLAVWPKDEQDFRKTAEEGSEALCISRWVKVVHFLYPVLRFQTVE